MAVLPTPEENARKVLDIFQHFKARPKSVLRVNNIVSVGARRRWEMADLQQGLEFAVRQGWIDRREGNFELTPAGFEKM